ncbi:MAG TPA: hypothetical protein VHB20_06710 [Verrucomicrobiae bacterium]|jgi:hypothetical protein|nr:hypothetical protein [Verrucomicrobiae bacterium]
MSVSPKLLILGALALSNIGALAQARVDAMPTNAATAYPISVTNAPARAVPWLRESRDPMELLHEFERQNPAGLRGEAAPVFTVEDGMYRLVAPAPPRASAPDAPNAVAAWAGARAAQQPEVDFSPAATFRKAEASRQSLDISKGTGPDLEVPAPEQDRAVQFTSLGGSDGVEEIRQQARETFDGSGANGMPTRIVPSPQVITPEPSVMLLGGIFTAALGVFFKRRQPSDA